MANAGLSCVRIYTDPILIWYLFYIVHACAHECMLLIANSTAAVCKVVAVAKRQKIVESATTTTTSTTNHQRSHQRSHQDVSPT